jgi:hypothetical protein
MMLSQNLIFVIVFTVHFHVTTWAQSGRLVGGEGVHNGSHQSLSDARHFPIDLRLKHSPAFRRHVHFNRFKNQNIFPQIAAAVLMLAAAQYVPMKRKKLSKTLKVAKKSISSHKLFIIIVTSTIHYATENNCKEISQDRMHHHVWKTAKLNDLSNCLFFILQAKMRSTM